MIVMAGGSKWAARNSQINLKTAKALGLSRAPTMSTPASRAHPGTSRAKTAHPDRSPQSPSARRSAALARCCARAANGQIVAPPEKRDELPPLHSITHPMPSGACELDEHAVGDGTSVETGSKLALVRVDIQDVADIAVIDRGCPG